MGDFVVFQDALAVTQAGQGRDEFDVVLLGHAGQAGELCRRVAQRVRQGAMRLPAELVLEIEHEHVLLAGGHVADELLEVGFLDSFYGLTVVIVLKINSTDGVGKEIHLVSKVEGVFDRIQHAEISRESSHE